MLRCGEGAGISARRICNARPAAATARRCRLRAAGSAPRRHGPHRDEVRRHLRRRSRPYPHRRRPGEARGGGRARGGGGGLGHGGRHQRAGALVPGAVAAARRAGIRHRRRHRRAGDERAARHRAPGRAASRRGPGRAGRCRSGPTARTARRGWRRSMARSWSRRMERRPGAGGRRLPGHRAARARDHPGARRVGPVGGGAGGGGQGRPLRHLHGRRRRLHHRPAHRAAGAEARAHLLRGNAGTRLGGRQGVADPLGRAGDEAAGPGAGALLLRGQARLAGGGRGRDRGTAPGQRHRLFPGRRQGDAPAGAGPAGHRGERLRRACRWRTSMST